MSRTDHICDECLLDVTECICEKRPVTKIENSTMYGQMNSNSFKAGEPTIGSLVEQIEQANEAYRKGEPLMSDQEYDDLVDQLQELDSDHPLLKKIGIAPEDDSRKQELPIIMASMNKVKTLKEIHDWFKSKKISASELLICMPKYDGISICAEENNLRTINDAWTRGDGSFGQFIPDHFALTNRYRQQDTPVDFVHIEAVGPAVVFGDSSFYTNGELIMSRKNFEKYRDQYKNPRNLVSGKVNDKIPTEILKDCDYIRYGLTHTAVEQMSKDNHIDILNCINPVQVPCLICTISDLTEDVLLQYYNLWSKDYELDGIIVEVNDWETRENLGRETGSNNPCFARAYKGSFEMVKETKVEKITWQISKQGYLKPVINITPIELDGATVSNVFGDNAKFINGYQISEGVTIKVKRSGMIIPRVVAVNHHSKDSTWIEVKKDYYPFTENWLRPTTCEHCNSKIDWNENKVEFICTNSECSGSSLQRMIAFFEILECDGVSDGVCQVFYDKGYQTIKSVLELTAEQMASWDGWGKLRAEKIHKSIKSKLVNVPIEKIQHASGKFKSLGSKKLVLLKHFKSKPTLEQITTIEGFSEITAKSYLDGIDKFWAFIAELPDVTIQFEESVVKAESDKCKGMSFVFTGFRSKELELAIKMAGGEIGSSVSKKTTHLVMKEKGSGSSKEKKAVEAGVTIFNESELKAFLK